MKAEGREGGGGPLPMAGERGCLRTADRFAQSRLMLGWFSVEKLAWLPECQGLAQ